MFGSSLALLFKLAARIATLVFFCQKIIDIILKKSIGEDVHPKKELAPLTARETEIVQLIAQGLIAKEIASRLNLSTHTVYTHRKKIMKKLELTSSSELILYALQNGLVAKE